jgi:hypothetical protein
MGMLYLMKVKVGRIFVIGNEANRLPEREIRLFGVRDQKKHLNFYEDDGE